MAMQSGSTSPGDRGVHHLLVEREKELDALYQLAARFTRTPEEVEPLLSEVAAILRDAMQYPECAVVEVEADDWRAETAAPTVEAVDALSTCEPDSGYCHVARRTYSLEKSAAITVCYRRSGSGPNGDAASGAGSSGARSSDAGSRGSGSTSPSPSSPGLSGTAEGVGNSVANGGTSREEEVPLIEERERHLIDSTAALLADVLERKDMDEVLRESTKTLQRQTAELERKNVAMREVLSQIEWEKQETLRNAATYLETFVQPYLHQLECSSGLSEQDRRTLRQLTEALGGLFSTGARKMLEMTGTLSPREMEICGLIRNGLSTKQIASFLRIAESTVERHRNTIRKKLNLNGERINLTSYLRSLQ